MSDLVGVVDSGWSPYSFYLDTTARVLVLVDRCQSGERSLSNALDEVLLDIEKCYRLKLGDGSWDIIYRDTHQVWDGVQWDGRKAHFYVLSVLRERRRREKRGAQSK